MAEMPRVQLVISGWSFAFLLLSGGLLFGGYWIYTHPPPPPPPPPDPPYYVNRVPTAVRPCYQCLVDRKMKTRNEWKMGRIADIPPDEKWWFAPVEKPTAPVSIDGMPMLALHPARDQEKPWYGFNERQVVLVPLQDLEPKFSIDHPPPPPAEPEISEAPPESTIPEDAEAPGEEASPPESPPVSTAPQQP